MTGTTSSNLAASGGSNSASVTITTNGTTTRIAVVAIPITISVKIPAHTVYTVKMDYKFTIAGIHGRIAGISDDWWDTPGADYMILIASTGANSKVSGLRFNPNNTSANLSYGSHASSNGVSMYNNTDSETTVSVYNYYYYLASDGNAGNTYTGSLIFNSCIVEKIESIGKPTEDGNTTATYDGQPKTFNFTYDSPTISTYNTVNYTTAFKNIDTTIVAEDYNHSTISDYTLDTTTVDGTLVASKAGTYTLKFNLKQSAINAGIRWSGGGTGEQTITFTINQAKVTPPNENTSPKDSEYTGSTIPFSLVNFDSNTMKVVSAVGDNGSAVTALDGSTVAEDTNSFAATSVDKYTVTVKLKDENNYVWGDTLGGTGSRTAKFEITKKELGLSIKASSTEWEADDETVTFTVTEGSTETETLSLLFYYDNEQYITGETVGKTTTISMKNIPVGEHTFYVALNGSSGDNANYKLTKNNTLDFEVTTASASTDFSWTYSENGTKAGAIAENDQIKYKLANNTAVEYSVAVALSDEQKDYIEIKGYTNQKSSTVGKVETVVTLESKDDTKLFPDKDGNNTLTTTTVTFNWEIVQGEFDMTGVRWEYSLDGKDWKEYTSAVDYNDGLSIKVRVKASTLPDGFKLSSTYSGDSKKEVDNHTSTVNKAYYEYDTVSFKAPAELTLDWEIKAKNLYTQWKPQAEDFTNDNGSGKFIAMVLSLDDKHAGYVDYKYYDMDNGGAEVTLDDIKAAATMTDIRHYKVEAYIKDEHKGNYEVSDGGATPATTFETGSDKTIATATVDGKTAGVTAVYSGSGLFGADSLKVTGDDNQKLDFTVTYYKGDKPVDGNELEGLPTDAGEYVILFELAENLKDDYVLLNEWIKVTVLPKPIALPEVGEVTFNNEFVKFENLLGGSYTEYKDVAKIELGGTVDGVKKAGTTYTATLTIKNPNYCWADGAEKAAVKYALTDGASWSADDTVATCEWKINPYVLKASSWNLKGKDGAVYSIPSALTEGLEGAVQLWYYTDKASEHLGEEDTLKAGNTYFVKAELLGEYKDCFVFEDSKTSISDFATYTVPQSGAAAALGVIKNFLNKVWLGLPVWAWLLIALAVLIMLIIIIAVACKRRKTKEQREEIKARKEEEKQRREEERRMQQERLEAERELARAKQEAELEKIRAQAGMAGAGMATMVMAQQPQQQVQPVQQPVQQMPVQQPVQMPQYQPYPMPQPQYPYPMTSMSDVNAIAEAKAAQAIAEAKAAEAHARAAEAVAEAKAAQAVAGIAPWQHGGMNYGMQQQPQMQMPQQPLVIVLDEHGQVKAMQQLNQMQQPFQPILITAPSEPKPAQKAEPAQIPEESATVSTPTMYPADAVITTTTTVDTTQKPVRRERDSANDFSDVDGFYDSIDF